MINSCNNCQRYPLCRQFTDITKILQYNSIVDNSNKIFIAIAESCYYYKND